VIYVLPDGSFIFIRITQLQITLLSKITQKIYSVSAVLIKMVLFIKKNSGPTEHYS